MNLFDIVYYENAQYNIIVYSLSYENPLKYLNKIAEELKSKEIYNSIIYFDMLLFYGNTQKRFYKAKYENNKFVSNSLENIIVSKNNVLRKYSVEYYKNKENIINHSILNSVQKKAIFKGLAV